MISLDGYGCRRTYTENMLNTSSGVQHSNLHFSFVTSSTPSDQDFSNYSSGYGNPQWNDNSSLNIDMTSLDDFFPHEFYSNSEPNLPAGLSPQKNQSFQFDKVESPDSISQISEKRIDKHTSKSNYGSLNISTTSDDAVCDTFGGNAREPKKDAESNKHSKEVELTSSSSSQCGVDPEKRGGSAAGVVARGKGRPVKTTQSGTGSGSGGCKPLIQCFTCNKTFNNSSALAKHKLIHSDDRKYCCGICSKSFKRQDHLHGHMMTHSTKKPYECCFARCDKSYCDARSLRRHHENHHFQLMESSHREFSTTPGDGKIFNPSSFKLDMTHWTTGLNPLDEPKPVKCSSCGKRFRNLPALNGHMRLHGGYVKQVKPELQETTETDSNILSESVEASTASLASEDLPDQSNEKNDCLDHLAVLMPNPIKQEFSGEHYWSSNSTQNWGNSDLEYALPIAAPDSTTSGRRDSSNNSVCNQFFQGMDKGHDLKGESVKNVAHFYSSGQPTFQKDTMASNFIQSKVASSTVPHPSLSSPCPAASPPSTPSHLKHCYNATSYNSKFYRRAVTPSYAVSNQNVFIANKCYQNMHHQQSHQLHLNGNLQRTTSAVFPQGHPQSPYSTNNYTPASATTSNFFQFPPSYEVLSPNMNPMTSQNHNQFVYTHQFPSTSPFLAAQSRPRTPFTPNTPGRSSCRQHHFYYNHGEESPQTPNMRSCHKTPTYHPYHSGYRYYPQLKHQSSVQNFTNLDSEFNQCLEMLEKGNINNLSTNPTTNGNVVQPDRSAPLFGSNVVKQPNTSMGFASGDGLTDDLDRLVADAVFCPTLDANPNSEWMELMCSSESTLDARNYGSLFNEAAIKDEMHADAVYNSSFSSQDVKSCEQFHNLPVKIANDPMAISFNAASAKRNSAQFPANAFHFSLSHPPAQQQNPFNSDPVREKAGLHRIESAPGCPTSSSEKRKKKHKPEPLWIPANVSNFANTGGCFIDHSAERDPPTDTERRKVSQKPPPPPYSRAAPSGASSSHNTPLHPKAPLLPSTAPPSNDFSLNLNDPISSGCEFEIDPYPQY